MNCASWVKDWNHDFWFNYIYLTNTYTRYTTGALGNAEYSFIAPRSNLAQSGNTR